MAEVFIAACERWTNRRKPISRSSHETAPIPALVRSAFDLPADSEPRSQKRSTRPSPSTPRPLRDGAQTCQRDRAHREWTEVGWSIADYLASLESRIGDLWRPISVHRREGRKTTTERASYCRDQRPMDNSSDRACRAMFDSAFAESPRREKPSRRDWRRARWARSPDGLHRYRQGLRSARRRLRGAARVSWRRVRHRVQRR